MARLWGDANAMGPQGKRSLAMTTLKVGIASYEQFKKRTMAIARGEYRRAVGEPKVWFSPSAIASCWA